MTTASFSTNPQLPIGSWVQLNMQPYETKPGPPYPSVEERTIGIIRSAYVAQGQQFYQIVWNPRGNRPETGMYTADQVIPLNSQQVQTITQEMQTGAYTPQGGWNAQ
jgi:hypothetical protein